MEHQNILNLLNKPNDSRFVTKNISFNDQSNANYDERNKIFNKTEVLNLIFVITIKLTF